MADRLLSMSSSVPEVRECFRSYKKNKQYGKLASSMVPGGQFSHLWSKAPYSSRYTSQDPVSKQDDEVNIGLPLTEEELDWQQR